MVRRRNGGRATRKTVQALPVLAGILMASSLVRLGDGTGSALVDRFGIMAAYATTTPEPVASDAAQDPIAEILTALQDREEELNVRESRIATREAGLIELREKLSLQMAELSQAEDALTRLLKMAQTAADDDLARLTNVYESMTPKEAAALFSEMSPIFAAGFLARMRPDAAAAIMAGLDPATAYSISVLIAGRNAELTPND